MVIQVCSYVNEKVYVGQMVNHSLFSNSGQVHRARLKGQELVVKVQRPGLKDLFDIDLKNLRVSVKTFLS